VKEVPLAPDALVVRVVETPADRPALAELREETGDLDLAFVAVFEGAVVEPAGHGGGWTESRRCARESGPDKTIAANTKNRSLVTPLLSHTM